MDRSLEAARCGKAPSPSLTLADSSSIKYVMAAGQYEKVGKRANVFQEASCQAQASLKSHNLLTFAGSVGVMNIPLIYEAGSV